MIVVDASVVIDLLLGVPDSEALAERLFDAREILNAPHLLDMEVAQVLQRYARVGELSAERGAAALRDLSDLPIERWPHTVLLPRLWDHRNNVTPYDAAYLALAEALDCPVLTRDARFAKAPPSPGRAMLV